jgi:hypothetical protein
MGEWGVSDPALPAVPCAERDEGVPSPPAPSRAARRGWPLAAAAGATLPAFAVLLSERTLAWRDTLALHAPLRPLVVDALRQLRLPLWNPHEALGVPLFAQMLHGVLHPVSLVAALVAPGAGMDAFIVAYVALAAVGAGVLARTLGASPGAAAVAALAYGLSGYVLGMSSVLLYLCAAATAPWTVAALRTAGRGSRWGVVAAGAAVAVQHLAGDPQWTIVAVALGAALAIDAGGARGLGRAAASLAVGTAIAGIQLAPTWAYLGESLRGGGLSEGDRAQWALAPARLVELVAPGFFGGRPGVSLVRPVFLWLGGPTQPGLSIPFVPSVFLGAAVVALAVAGARTSRAARVLAAAAAVLLWMALGVHAGAEQVLHAVPVWGSFRYAEKLVGPLTLAVAALAALGCDRVAGAPGRTRDAAPWLAAGALAAIAAAMLSASPGLEALAPGGAPQAAIRAARVALGAGLPHAAAALAALAALRIAAAHSTAVRRSFAPAAAALVLVQSTAASPYALRAGVPDARAQRPLAELRGVEPVTRIETPVDPDTFVAPAPLDDADREVAVRSRMGAAPYAVPSGVDQVNTYTGVIPRRLRVLGNALGPDSWRSMRRFAVTHVVLYEPGEAPGAEAADAIHGGREVATWPEWRLSAWAVPHRPWAVFAERVAFAATEEEALGAYVAADLAGMPTVILEGTARAAAGPGRVLSAERGDDRVRIEAEGTAGTLVVNDAWWPGWQATIDGRPVAIWRADFLVRAVPWPAGRHVLEMRYEPEEVRAGWIVSACGLAALALAAALTLRRRGATAR